MKTNHEHAIYAETLAFTFIKAMNEKDIPPGVQMAAGALAFIKTCRAAGFSEKEFRKIMVQMCEDYRQSMLDD